MTYQDGRISCTDDAVRISGYYFPWGTKVIPYARIASAEPVQLMAFRGRARIWGTANPRYWANLDAARPRKSTGFVLDLGAAVRPLVTPDDPDAFAQALREHGVTVAAEAGPGPII